MKLINGFLVKNLLFEKARFFEKFAFHGLDMRVADILKKGHRLCHLYT
jgi:hypothetical protein